jgi:hypothetical protein
MSFNKPISPQFFLQYGERKNRDVVMRPAILEMSRLLPKEL